MSLSIGQLNLQLVGDSKGLQKMLPDLNRLGKKIDQLGKSQEASAQKAVGALAKQETAIRKQIKAVKALNAKLREKGADPSLMAANVNALKAFTRTLSKGTLNAAEFSRANDRLNKTLGKTTTVARKSTTALKPEKVGGMVNALRNLESASVLAVGPLSGVGARIRSLGAIASRSALAMALFAGTIVGIAVVAFKMASAAIRTAKALEKIHARLKVVGGSSAQASAHFRFVTKTAKSMGLQIESSAEAYSQLAAATKNTAAEGKITRTVFEGLSAAGASMRLSAEQMTGAFRAVQQIASKGKVQAEELIGQLAERIPNAIQIAADAFETTQAGLLSLVSNGLVPASEFLDKFGRQLVKTYGSSAKENILSIEGATNRLANAQFMFNKKLNDATGVSKTWIGFLNDIAEAIESVTANMDAAALAVDYWAEALGRLNTQFTDAMGSFNRTGLEINKQIRGWFAPTSNAGKELAGQWGHVWGAIMDSMPDMGDASVDFSAWTDFWLNMKVNAAAAAADAEKLKDALQIGLSDEDYTRLIALQDSMAEMKLEAQIASGAFGALTAEMVEMAMASGVVFENIGGVVTRTNLLPPALQAALDAWISMTQKANAGVTLDEIVENTRTETEKLALAFENLDKAAALASFNFGGPEDIEKLNLYLDAIDRARDKLTDTSKAAQALGDSLVNGMEQAIFSGKKFTEVLKDMLKEIMKIILRETVLNGIGKAFGSALSGGLGFATGGRTPANETFMVGEKGPELLSFGKSGNVTPNDAIQRSTRHGKSGAAGAVVHQTNTFTTNVKDDVRAIIAEALPEIVSATSQAMIDESQRRGIVNTFG